MNIFFNNFLIDIYSKYIYSKNFYNHNKITPSNNDNYLKFKKMHLMYTNPRWNDTQKKLLWNSFDYELELANKKPQYTYHSYNHIYYNFFHGYSKCDKKNIYGLFKIKKNPYWNIEKQKLEWW